ncbi:MAG: type transport system ATP-binding protein [Acidobacteriota bacterium]|jgi:ABC-2 type transport system ATP-binding protein|nr:type transport system ATP-binding protein [Acidobacteriota bacterium]
MIEALDLSKRHPNGKLALDALNLRVEAGEIYCLLGAKGAGKTTAINLFLGFAEPTSGSARIDGVDVAREPLRAKARVAYLADTTAFYHRLTTLQNLDFFARLGGRRALYRRDCEMALRQVGLPESAFDQRVSELGPGSIRKLGIAAALMKGAPALVLDEPLSGLDPKAAAELVEILEELRDQGRALLITMQDLFWARQLADRVGILQEGRQALTRSRDELRFENLEKLYLDYMRGGLRELAAQ